MADLRSDADKDGRLELRMRLRVSDYGQLSTLLGKLDALPGVEHARRDFQDMLDHNCTAVLLALSEFDLDFRKPAIRETAQAAREMGLTVYLDTTRTDPTTASELEARWKKFRDQAASAGAPDALLRDIEESILRQHSIGGRHGRARDGDARQPAHPRRPPLAVAPPLRATERGNR